MAQTLRADGPPAVAAAPQLLGLDWGSSRLRAYLLGPGGELLATRRSEAGASALHDGPAFAGALQALVGDWQAAHPALPMLACGMVGSRHGWREAPYVRCPAGAAELAQHTLALDNGLRIVPGLRHDGDQPDVMRGEETQILGALALHPALCTQSRLVLPGTHSKWARVEDGRITGFATHLTGELYALLRRHSVLARLMPPADDAEGCEVSAGLAHASGAFVRGVQAARRDGGLLHQLFAVRTLGLLQQLEAEDLPDYLSGLLIGHELATELRGGVTEPLALVGEPVLCARYAQALACFGQAPPLMLDNTAAAGLWLLAHCAPRP